MDAFYSNVCPTCGGFHFEDAAFEDIDLSKEIDNIISQLYNDRPVNYSSSRLASKVANTISGAVADNYGSGFFQVEWESPDWEMIHNLQKNVWHFSYAKTYQQLQATTSALYSNGKIVPFNEFADVARRINGEYNGTYLRTEYDTAIASAQSASRWKAFQDEKDIFPNLSYETVGDANVRQSHQVLDGVTRPINDNFWITYYPPNGWKCRCSTRQSFDQVTDVDKIIYPTDIPKMFKTNLAANGLVFPKDHPYYTELPKSVLTAADGNNPYLYERAHKSKSGGYVYTNALNKGSESEMSIAKLLAEKGDRVIFLPEINKNNSLKAIRSNVLPNVKEGRNPDVVINGKIFEMKSCNGKIRTIKNSFNEARKQSENIIIKYDEKVNQKDLKRLLKGQVNASPSVAEVWMIDEADNVKKYERSEILNFYKSKKQK